jgi:hypothetical protein
MCGCLPIFIRASPMSRINKTLCSSEKRIEKCAAVRAFLLSKAFFHPAHESSLFSEERENFLVDVNRC